MYIKMNMKQQRKLPTYAAKAASIAVILKHIRSPHDGGSQNALKPIKLRTTFMDARDRCNVGENMNAKGNKQYLGTYTYFELQYNLVRTAPRNVQWSHYTEVRASILKVTQ